MKNIMPMQPYVQMNVKDYKLRKSMELGVSHYYEFALNSSMPVIDAVPDASIDLLFNIGDNKVKTYVSGTVFKAKYWEMGENDICFGVRFQPGQGILPKEISIDMLINNDLEIDGDIFGKGLTEQIALAESMDERYSLFRTAYQKMIEKEQLSDSKKNIVDYMIKRIYETNGRIVIGELAEETNYSSCYLRRVFREKNGISPKQFAQYIRFQSLLEKNEKQKLRYDELALECGYYDEPHMMKEFKLYSGITLEKYRELRSKTIY